MNIRSAGVQAPCETSHAASLYKKVTGGKS